MNRILLIGNGFDLAHKMRTSYKEFIENYWQSIIKKIQEKSGQGEFSNQDIRITEVPNSWESEYSFQSLVANLKRNKSKLIFNNKFLEIITETAALQNWVDIENEYYKILKKIIKDSPICPYKDIVKLNNDFERIKNNLKDYLVQIEQKFDREFREPSIKNEIGTKIYSSFKLKDFTEEVFSNVVESEYEKIQTRQKNLFEGTEHSSLGNNIILDQNSTHPKKDVKKLLFSKNASENFDLTPDQVIFLNFNYTHTPFLYDDKRKYLNFPHGFSKEVMTEFINIHGELNNPDNPIIFGFGDEIDEYYRKIEDLNDNKYLHNIKSIRYLDTDNYKRLLRILDDDYFQVFILGHSCGISDRTLLNTLFEHPNCGSIKTFYYENGETDNFSDIARNISRNFNDKSKMRERVVNKTYCKPLIE